MVQERVVVGIDVSKARLDVAVGSTGDPWSELNDSEGITRLVGRLQALSVDLVIVEATGGQQDALAGALAAAGLVRPARAQTRR